MLVAMFLLQAVAAKASQGFWPLLLLILPAITAIMFVFVLSFHDASHGRLYPLNWLNEVHGHFVGTLSFTPLAVYRYAHARHHAQLARQGDPELWPFNSPHISRPLRVIAALAEILLGMVYTPLLFLRSVIIGELSPRERRLIVRGYFGCFAVWIAILAIVWEFELWGPFLIVWVVPSTISGMLQTLNKFEQHLGLHGETVLGLTRTVIDRHPAAELVAEAMLFNNLHGTHHRYAKIPYYQLPHATPFTLASAREHCPVFPSLASATFDMLLCLSDPKAGPQWIMQQNPCGRLRSHHVAIAHEAQPVFTGEYAA